MIPALGSIASEQMCGNRVSFLLEGHLNSNGDQRDTAEEISGL